MTTNFVLDEVVTLLARRAGASFAADRARAILTSERLTVVRPTPDDELVALEMLEKLGDKDVSFTDCVSFVTMRARGIRRAFTFDRHFRDAGFVLWPATRSSGR